MTLQEWSLSGHVLNLWIVYWSEIQDGHHDLVLTLDPMKKMFINLILWNQYVNLKQTSINQINSNKANMAWMVLRWSTFKIMSCDPDLHPRCHRQRTHSFNIGPYGKNDQNKFPLKPVTQFKANMEWMVLKWSIFKIVSDDPDLHPRWRPSADIVLT